MITNVEINRTINDPIDANRWRSVMNRIDQVLNYQTRWSRFSTTEGETDPRRDINDECGYPATENISLQDYRTMYERNPIAKKVVDLLPSHCWQVHPDVYEDEAVDEDTELVGYP